MNLTPCAAPEFRQFDFWIGVWDVTSQGHPAGHSKIDVILDGCAILENWRITWTPNADGKTWAVTFDGLYKPVLVPSPSQL